MSAVLNEFAHLDPSVQSIAGASNVERAMHMLKHVYIRHKNVQRVHQFVEFVMRRPRSYRPNGLFVFGDAGCGKTQVLHAIERQHNKNHATVGAHRKLPVLYIEVPAVVTPANLVAKMLHAAGVPRRLRQTDDLPILLLASVLAEMETKIVFMDEAQNLVLRDPNKLMLPSLKEIFNTLKIPSVLAGTEAFLPAYDQLAIASRWPFMIDLPLWTDTPDFQSLLHAWQRALPLRLPSSLDSLAMRKAILNETGGIMDLISQCLSAAGIAAIRLKRECITEDLLSWWRDPPMLAEIEDDALAIAEAWLADDREGPEPLSVCGRHFRSRVTGGMTNKRN